MNNKTHAQDGYQPAVTHTTQKPERAKNGYQPAPQEQGSLTQPPPKTTPKVKPLGPE